MTPIEPYAKVVARLLQGPLYDDENTHWQQLRLHLTGVNRQFAGLGLELVYAERDGLAFLRQMLLNDESDTVGLIPRHPLTYEQSLLCVVLRDWLDEFDTSDALTKQLYVTRTELLDRIDLFLREQPNKLKQRQQMERQISAIEKLGFIRPIRTEEATEERYEVRRILKYKVTLDDLETFREVLAASLSPANPASFTNSEPIS
jgi:hypothetical protein